MGDVMAFDLTKRKKTHPQPPTLEGAKDAHGEDAMRNRSCAHGDHPEALRVRDQGTGAIGKWCL